MPNPRALPRPWVRAYPPGVPASAEHPRVGLPRLLDAAVRDFPWATALVGGDTELTWRALRGRVDRTVTVLDSLRVAAGTRVAVALPDVPAAVATMFAAWRLGAVVVPLDAMLPDVELRRRLRRTSTGVLVCRPATAARLAPGTDALPDLRLLAVTRDGRRSLRRRLAEAVGAATGRSGVEPGASVGVRDLDRLLAGAEPRRGGGRAGPADAAVLQHTSGRRGQSRAAVLTHANLVAAADQARLWIPDIREGRERVLSALPLTHPAGLVLGLLTGVLSGATVLLEPEPEPARLLRTVSEHRPTLLTGTPATYRSLVDHPAAAGRDLTSLRACLSTGAALPGPLADRFERLTGARVRQGYGVAEAGWLTHADPVTAPGPTGGIGLPVTGTVAAVLDPGDPTRVLPAGRAGRLAVHGPQVAVGYWRDEPAAGGALHDGWLLTGDTAVMDQTGAFRLAEPGAAGSLDDPPVPGGRARAG